MRLFALVLAVACLLAGTPGTEAAIDRHGLDGAGLGRTEVRHVRQPYQHRAKKQRAHKREKRIVALMLRDRGHELKVRHIRARIVAHPEGCPRVRFCGCGVSLHVFGKRVRDLYLAANWRRFKPAPPAPGTVAWRYGHVFAVVKVLRHGVVLAYDPNSGRGLTRVHVRRLAGYKVVDPRRG